MKQTGIIFISFILIQNLCFAQFKFSDTTLYVGDKIVTSQLFNPDCQIDISAFPFIDSLAKFLLKNENIVIEINFHSDVRGDYKMNQARTEVCGKDRLKDMFASRYPKIKQDRIIYKCHGESQPIFTQKAIDKIPNEIEKKKAHAANRRTVVNIISVIYK